jgi:hypothetical protein
MTKSDVFLIISQIYFVGSIITDREKSFLSVIGWFWLILTFICWVVQ